MAHTKAGGSTQYGRDSVSKRLGIKRFGGQNVQTGSILVRQRGTAFHAGSNVRRGNDDTLYARLSGTVRYSHRKIQKFNGKRTKTRFVSVEPS